MSDYRGTGTKEPWRVAGSIVLSGDIDFDFERFAANMGISLDSLDPTEDEDWPGKKAYSFVGYADSQQNMEKFVRTLEEYDQSLDVLHMTDPPGKRIEFYSSSS